MALLVNLKMQLFTKQESTILPDGFGGWKISQSDIPIEQNKHALKAMLKAALANSSVTNASDKNF